MFCLFVVIAVDNVLVPTVISFAQVSTVKVNATRWALAMTPMVHAVKRYGLLLYTTCIGLMLRILTFEFVFQHSHCYCCELLLPPPYTKRKTMPWGPALHPCSIYATPTHPLIKALF